MSSGKDVPAAVPVAVAFAGNRRTRADPIQPSRHIVTKMRRHPHYGT